MKKIELLAPAGNFECLKQAVNNGANAVYLGGSLFSARAFADNFELDEVKQAIDYAHLRNVKVYITINTLLNEYEIMKAFELAKAYYDLNVDALLVQDLGLLSLIREKLPDLEVHASTQMHIHNLEGLRSCIKLGIERAVIARESSLDFIKEACRENIEIECFVHGAICVSYSGECLMSSLTRKRSANKGMCAQCCRLKYELYEDGNKVKTDTDYLLSPKDMYLLEDIPELIKAGVSSLKIEGRMKSPAYVGYVTRLYREAIDACYDNQDFKITDEELNQLKLLFNRGFTDTYLKNDNSVLFHNKRPNHMGIKVGKVIKVKGNTAYIKLNTDIKQFDAIRALNSKEDSGLILNVLKVKDKMVSKAYKGEVIEVNFKAPLKVDDEVFKTQDMALEKEITDKEDLKLPVSLKISGRALTKLKVQYEDFVYESDFLLDSALKQPVNEEILFKCFKSCDKHPYYIEDIEYDIDDFFVPKAMLNEFRRNFYDELDNYRLSLFKREVIPYDKGEITVYDRESQILKEYSYKDNEWNFSPVVNNNCEYGADHNVVADMGGLFLEGDKIGYYSLNVTNSYAYEFLLRHGFRNVILSLELNGEMIDELVKAFKERNSIEIKPYIFYKGRRELMHILRDPFKDYVKNYDKVLLTDGVNKYRIIKRKGFVDIIEYDIFNSDIDRYSKFFKYNYPDEL
ncbi:MAG: DUF3656 domain-containing protein [Erysipelotrichaceae bacterium]